MPGIHLIGNLQCFGCLSGYLFALANEITGMRPEKINCNTVLAYYIVFENWSGQANGLAPLQLKTKIIFVTVLVRNNHNNGSVISQMWQVVFTTCHSLWRDCDK